MLKDSIPNKFAPVISAHASLACYKKFEDDVRMVTWINSVFTKVVCKVNDSEFEKLKTENDYVVLTESNLENKEACIAFCPRPNYPEYFKSFKLWCP